MGETGDTVDGKKHSPLGARKVLKTAINLMWSRIFFHQPYGLTLNFQTGSNLLVAKT